MDVTINRPYVLASLLGPSVGLDIAGFNIFLDSTVYVEITVPNIVLVSTVCIKNSVFGSTSHNIDQYLLIKKSIVLGPNSKSWG